MRRAESLTWTETASFWPRFGARIRRWRRFPTASGVCQVACIPQSDSVDLKAVAAGSRGKGAA